jgi:hypothetical protein
MTDASTLTIGVMLLIPVALIVGLWIQNYRKTDSAPAATERTSDRVVGFVVATLVSIAIAFSSVAGLAGAFGEVISMFPGGTAQLLLGTLAVAGFSGVVELSVVGATILVLIVIFGASAVRNR